MGFFSPTCDDVADNYPRIDGKVAIVTGSSTGIGQEIARVLCKRGARVIMPNRTKDKAEKAASEIRKSLEGVKDAGTVEVMDLDLMDFQSVKSFSEEFAALGVPLDILVLNAGIMATPLRYTKQGWESQMGVNHLGHFALTRWLLPSLRASDGARVVSMSSRAHRVAHKEFDWPSLTEGYKGFYSDKGAHYERYKVYGDSKSANILFAKEFARRFGDEGIFAASSHPGVVYTDLSRDFMAPFRYAWNIFGIFIFKTPPQGAAPTVRAVLDSTITPGSYVGPTLSGPVEQIPKPHCENMQSALRLWNVSEEIVSAWEEKSN